MIWFFCFNFEVDFCKTISMLQLFVLQATS